jgi:hypothetical protein
MLKDDIEDLLHYESLERCNEILMLDSLKHIERLFSI